jgi:radical SAM-linked protein
MSDQRLLFEKEGRACYISHLDLMRTFQRAFLRAGIDIKHTEGFNPHAFVSIILPLSVGYSSECELLEFGLLGSISQAEVPERLNAALPEGIFVRECYDAQRPAKQLTHLDWTVILEYDAGLPDGAAAALGELLGRESLVVDKKSKKSKTGFTQVDIIPMVKQYTIMEGRQTLVLNGVLAAQNPSLNPELIVAALGREYPEFAPDFVRCHRNEVLDADGAVFR